MTHLCLFLLGPWESTRDGVPVTLFHTAKVRALPANLAVERKRPHSRESLAGQQPLEVSENLEGLEGARPT